MSKKEDEVVLNIPDAKQLSTMRQSRDTANAVQILQKQQKQIEQAFTEFFQSDHDHIVIETEEKLHPILEEALYTKGYIVNQTYDHSHWTVKISLQRCQHCNEYAYWTPMGRPYLRPYLFETVRLF